MSQIEELYQKGKQESSPASLDNLLLNAAKQSCEKSVTKNKTKKWLYALPTAAVVMLSLSLIINLQNENQDMMVAPTVNVSAPKAQVAKDEISKGFQMGALKHTQPLEKQTVPNKPRKKSSSIKSELKIDAPKAEIMTTMEHKPISHKLIQPYNQSQSKTKPKYNNRWLNKNNAQAKTSNFTNTEESAAKEPISDMATTTIILPETDEPIGNQQRSKEFAKVKSAPKSKKRPSTLQAEIVKVEQLIKEKKYEQAQKILKLLKQNYPLYDFSNLENKLVPLPQN